MRHYIAIGYSILTALAMYCVHEKYFHLTFGDFQYLGAGDFLLAISCGIVVLIAPYVLIFTELRYIK